MALSSTSVFRLTPRRRWNQYLEGVVEWNPVKMEVLLAGSNSCLRNGLIPKLGGVVLPPSSLVYSVRVLLVLDLQVAAVASCRGPFLDRRTLASVTHVLVTFRLNDCNVPYLGPPLQSTWFRMQLPVSCRIDQDSIMQ